MSDWSSDVCSSYLALRASVVGVRRGLVKYRLFGGVPIAVCQFDDFRKRARSIFWFAAAHHHCDVLAQLAVIILGWRFATACEREHDCGSDGNSPNATVMRLAVRALQPLGFQIGRA